MSGLGERGFAVEQRGRDPPGGRWDESGSSPIRLRRHASGNPVRGKAQGRIDPPAEKLEDSDRRWESKPRSRTLNKVPGRSPFAAIASNQAIGHPDENKSGRTYIGVRNDTWARVGRNADATHPREQTCEGSNPRSAAERETRRKEESASLGKAAAVQSRRSGTPRMRNALVHDPRLWMARTKRQRSTCGWIGHEREHSRAVAPHSPARPNRRRRVSRHLGGLKCHRTTHPARPPTRAAPFRSC